MPHGLILGDVVPGASILMAMLGHRTGCTCVPDGHVITTRVAVVVVVVIFFGVRLGARPSGEGQVLLVLRGGQIGPRGGGCQRWDAWRCHWSGWQNGTGEIVGWGGYPAALLCP